MIVLFIPKICCLTYTLAKKTVTLSKVKTHHHFQIVHHGITKALTILITTIIDSVSNN